MANNYQESSTFIKIPQDKIKQTELILKRVENEIQDLDNNNEYLGFTIEIEQDGIWIYDQEYFNPENAEILIKALVEEL